MADSPPFAAAQIALGAGAPARGGLQATPGQTVQVSAVSIVGWEVQRWEWYDYPIGWTAPTGWSTDTDSGVIYSAAITPAAFTLPASTYGKWMLRLRINDAVTNQGALNKFTDESTAFEVLPVNGIHDLGSGETTQFDAQRSWTGHQKLNLAKLAVALPIVGIGSPEGAVPARVGSLYLRQDGGAGSTFYVKESGTGSTGWVSK